jgi:xanthine dehydrogenase accessory factor
MPGAGGETVEDGLVVDHNPCLSGGTMDIFLEPHLPAQRILIAGDTPIARALDAVASAAGYAVVRNELQPEASDAAVIVASHGAEEESLLARALDAGVGYVALVASDKRGAAVRDSLDVPEALREQVHTPAGLAIGARTPEEIAVAILAELISEQIARPPLPATTPVLAEAVDPICGMTVAATDASIHLDTDSGRVYFCSEGCRTTYIERHAAAH